VERVSDRRPIVLCEPDPDWPRHAAAEGATIMAACAPCIALVEHIGSTAVPGLAAKPVIDLMPALACFEDGQRCVEPMQRLGYEYRGEYGIAGRHFFVRGERGCSTCTCSFAGARHGASTCCSETTCGRIQTRPQSTRG
jgi:GrpB-like predicted nucleotidyltransferase (UPF0157 family)